MTQHAKRGVQIAMRALLSIIAIPLQEENSDAAIP